MGFSHYFEQNRHLTRPEWQQIASFAKLLFANDLKSDKELANGSAELNSEPEVTSEFISFNGVEEDGHETMVLERAGSGFHFCKTARKPYDRYVTALLIIADSVAPKALKVSSNGTRSNWLQGLVLANSVLPGAQIPDGIEE